MTQDSNGRTVQRNRVELIASILIGSAAVLTAIATYQGGELDGQVRDLNTEALAETSFANDVYNDANALRAIERDWFFSWLVEDQNNQPAAGYIINAMPPEVRNLIEEFFAAGDDGILNPFSPEAQEAYVSYLELPSVQYIMQGNTHRNNAQCAILEARIADNQGNWMGFANVFLAITLMTAGIAALLRSRIAQTVVLATAVLCLLMGVGLLLAGGDYAGSRAEMAALVFPEPDPNTGLQGLELADALCLGDPEPMQE